MTWHLWILSQNQSWKDNLELIYMKIPSSTTSALMLDFVFIGQTENLIKDPGIGVHMELLISDFTLLCILLVTLLQPHL